MEAIQKQIKELTDTGKNLITEAGQMSEVLQKQISAPMQELLAEGQALQTTLGSLPTQIQELATAASSLQKVRKQIVASADSVNSQIDTAQGKLNETKNAVDTANGKISDAKAQLESAASQVGSAQTRSMRRTISLELQDLRLTVQWAL